MESLGKNIKYYRMKKGLSEEGLARLLLVSPDLIRYWESDERKPSDETLEEIASLLKVSVSELTASKQQEKKVPIHLSETRGKLVGTCARCGKSIYSSDKYGLGRVTKDKKNAIHYEYDLEKNEGYDYFCQNCCKEIVSVNKISEENKLKEDERKSSRIMGASLLIAFLTLCAGAGVAVILYFLIDNNLLVYLIGAASIPLAYYVFSIIYSLLIGSNWIHDAVTHYARNSFVVLPKKILENDANDVLKTGIIKAAFLVVSYAIASATLIILIILLGICSMFCWPSFRRKNKLDIEVRKEEIDK